MPEIRPTFDDADGYERYMGLSSRVIGEQFLAWLARAPTQDDAQCCRSPATAA